MSYVLCLMSYVLCLMSYVLCPMSYVLCLMSFVFCLMSYVLCLISYVLCLMSYVLCLMSYVLCLMPHVLCLMSYVGPACIIVLLDASCLIRVNLSCIQDTADTRFMQPWSVRAGNKLRTDEQKRVWPKLHIGDMVRGRHPKTKDWSMLNSVFFGMSYGTA